ncbi:unnamed protein product [Anisakis simplex]|uniref:NAD(P)-binding protein n=1 Tax=Anisakis simplex TaxID=6269 RepID=A0A0M3KIQ8_ANISI|nr:unnamed protein product [Anisakis simplex]
MPLFRGRVIICGSGCTLFTVPSYGPYATSKSAVSKYAEVIRHELTPYGINVILIQPGSFDSGMQDTERLLEMMQSKWDCCDASLREEYGERFIRRVKKFCKVFQQHGVSKDVKWVEDTYFNALVAKYPKPLYRIGWDTILL